MSEEPYEVRKYRPGDTVPHGTPAPEPCKDQGWAGIGRCENPRCSRSAVRKKIERGGQTKLLCTSCASEAKREASKTVDEAANKPQPASGPEPEIRRETEPETEPKTKPETEPKRETPDDAPAPGEMLRNVASLRAKIWDVALRPVAVYTTAAGRRYGHNKPGKHPFGTGWQTAARRDPPAAVTDPPRLDATNTGILCDGLRAVDIDSDDAAVAARCVALAREMLGDAPTRYRSNSPRRLLLYRAAFGEPPKTKIKGTLGEIEVLGRGQQFVAFGDHESGVELQWEGDAPGAALRDSIPAVTEEQINAYLEIVRPIIGCESPQQKTNGQSEQPESTGDGGRWTDYLNNLIDDDSNTAFAYALLKSGMSDGAAVNFLTAAVRELKGVDEDRRQRRLKNVSGQVTSARRKINEADRPPANERLLVSRAQFLADFVAPDYLIDGILQRRFIYSLTGLTGAAKTALALELVSAVGRVGDGATFGNHTAEKGKCVYFVGENPDDARARIIGADYHRDDNPSADNVYFIPGVYNITQIRERIASEIKMLGGVDLVVIDTSAAYFLGDDELNNVQMGEHARMLRTLTGLPGGPCVLVLCHPVKYVTAADQLLPRGGSAFLNEIDGNLTAWKRDEDIVELHHTGKLRGPGFEPITFRLDKITAPTLLDSKGRMLPTVRAVAIGEQEEAKRAHDVRRDEDTLLLALLENADRSHRDLARVCKFTLANGEPYVSKVQRVAGRLAKTRLIKPGRGEHWKLTDEGENTAKKLKDAEDEQRVEDRSGALSSRPFVAVRGSKCGKNVPCIHCHVADGNVFKIGDGRLGKSQRHSEALHEGCAEAWYTGQPGPETPPLSPEPAPNLGLDPVDSHGAPETASAPLMLTQEMEHRLRLCGYSDTEIAHLTPQQAHEILDQIRPGS
jgi:hypothetical protein